MSHYDTNPEDLREDAKQFQESSFGKYVMGILQEKGAGELSRASDMNAEHPDRYLAKYNTVKEIEELLKNPLGDDNPSRG